jgi:tyrosine-specific transport protein
MSAATSSKSVFGATMLVTGCCIGAGMIGLPIKSALAGFLPSSFAMILCYIFTTITGLFIAEATLWFDGKVNLPSIVESILGKKGKLLTIVLFLSLFYSLFVAYLDGSGMIFSDIFSSITGQAVPKTVGIIFCTILVAAITYAGTHLANRFNQFLLFGLISSYVLLIAIGLTHVSPPSSTTIDIISTLNVIPIMLICFGYQNLVPSLSHYLNKNIKHIRLAIIIGNVIPLFIYALWNYVILGILPADLASLKNAEIITQLLEATMPIISIVLLVKSFSLFAMLTSFIPTSISLLDFIKDGMQNSMNTKIKHKIQFNINHDLFYLALIFIPSAIFTMVYPNLFLNMLDFAGGFIDVLLFGIMPAMLVLIGRKTIKGQHYQVFGGQITPIIILLASLFILSIKTGVI